MKLKEILKICSCILAGLVFSTTVFGQTPTPTPSPLPAFKIERSDRSVPFHQALIKDQDADDDDKNPWYLGIDKDEVVKFDLPECKVLDWDEDSQMETVTCFELVSSKPSVVTVLDDHFLVGMAKRGDAVITVREVTKKYKVENRGTISEEKIEQIKDKKVILENHRFSLGGSLRDFAFVNVRIVSNTDKKIIAVPYLKDYKSVRDTYGKGIAKNYMVVAVRIINDNSGKQFLVQNVSVSFDPNQCNDLADIWAGVGAYGTSLRRPPNETEIDEAAKMVKDKRKDCMDNYEKNFAFPNTILPIDDNTMLAVGEAEKYRSRRYQFFQAIRFAADVGGGLTAFNLLGRDGITGFNFLGGTLFNAADAALPKSADEKRENLRRDVPKENVIVKGNDHQVVNIFIPIIHVLKKPAWEKYKTSIDKRKDDETFHQYMKLFLVANSSGILIDENSKAVESKQGGGAATTRP